MRRLSELKLWPRNYREGDVEAIKRSIDRFGFNGALRVWRDDIVIAGNHSLKALWEMRDDGSLLPPKHIEVDGDDWCVLTIDVSHLDRAEAHAFAIADNRTTEMAIVKNEPLGELLSEIAKADEALLASTGYDKTQVAAFLRSIGRKPADAQPQADKADELREKWETAPGQLWRLGTHRLLIGDATDPEAVARLLDGARPNIMVTDPPYGVSYDPSWRATTKRKDGSPVSTGKIATGDVTGDDRADWREAWELFPGDVAYCWHGGLHADEVALSLRGANFEIRSQIIWAKPRFPISRGAYHWQHEPCFYAVRKGATASWIGGRKQSTLWEIENNDGANPDREDATPHGTRKPLECMARPIANHEGNVYDPFVGTGTTIIAAHNAERDAFALEIDPKYAAVVLQRFTDAFGDEPELLG